MPAKAKQAQLPPPESPLDLTRDLRDVSVTERGQFRSCRRRWWLGTIHNLVPKTSDDEALRFGSGIHEALEAFFGTRGALAKREAAARKAWRRWVAHEKERAPDNESFERVIELDTLGASMLEQYFIYDKVAPVQLGKVLAVEGEFLVPALKPKQPAGYPPEAMPVWHTSGRLLVPIVDPDTKEPIRRNGELVYLTMRLDMLTERKTPKAGIWIDDHKTSGSSPSDRGIDFDDQITGYTYGVWRWLAKLPRGVVFDYLIKEIPKAPRMVQPRSKDLARYANSDGLIVSTAKDQLTTPDMYREALKREGLMRNGRVLTTAHSECLGALLARGWDPFFRRYEVMRNEAEILNFERHLVQEHDDMTIAAEDPGKRYPNRSTWHCPSCPVRALCLAIEDGSDADFIAETQFIEGPDRKVARD